MTEGMSVLMVDDEPAVADLAGTYLERIDDRLDVTTETSVDAALEHVAAAPILP